MKKEVLTNQFTTREDFLKAIRRYNLRRIHEKAGMQQFLNRMETEFKNDESISCKEVV